MAITTNVEGDTSCLETHQENTSAQNDSAEIQTSESLTVTKEETRVAATLDHDHKNKLVLSNEGDNKAMLDQKAREEDDVESGGGDDNEDPFDGNSEQENGVSDNGNDDNEEELSEDENEDNDDVEEEDVIVKDGAREIEEIKNADNGKAVEEAHKSLRKNGRRRASGKNAEIMEPAPKNKKRRRGWTEIHRAKQEESKDKPESSSKKKAKKKLESRGMIFMCSSETKSDCYRYKVFGLPESKKDIVEQIYKGMRLFLYDVDLKLMYGIYKAAGTGGYNIEPKAFKSQFPSQVRFKVHKDYSPLPEEIFRNVMKENYYTKSKFDCSLNSQQVRKLCDLFISSRNVLQSTPSGCNKPLKGQSKLPAKSKRRKPDYKGGNSLNKDTRSAKRPRKYPRKAASPIEPHRQPLNIPQYVYERPSIMDTYRQDSYLRPQSPNRMTTMMWDPYSRRSSELYARDSYIDRDLYRTGSEHIVPYRELRRDVYPENLHRYRDLQIGELDRRNSNQPIQRSYLEAPTVPSQDRRVSDPYNIYSRAPVSDTYRVSYRPEVVDRPLNLISDCSEGVYLRDSYVPRRDQLSIGDPVYSAGYHHPQRGELLLRNYRM